MDSWIPGVFHWNKRQVWEENYSFFEFSGLKYEIIAGQNKLQLFLLIYTYCTKYVSMCVFFIMLCSISTLEVGWT